MHHLKRFRSSFTTLEPASQEGLTQIFEALSAGQIVEGWGSSVHRDFDSLFNSEGRLWERDRTLPVWVERWSDIPSPNDMRWYQQMLRYH